MENDTISIDDLNDSSNSDVDPHSKKNINSISSRKISMEDTVTFSDQEDINSISNDIKTNISSNMIYNEIEDHSKIYNINSIKNSSNEIKSNMNITNDLNSQKEINIELISNNLNNNSFSIVDAKDITKYFQNETQFSVKIIDTNNNPITDQTVTFNICNQSYTRTSNENGIATLNINLNPGIYQIITSYNGSTIKNNITVLPIIVDNKNIVKYYRNGTDYSVKVLNGNGDPAEGANVSFNINGVFYNRVCDENGVASLSINLNPGEYIITAIYNNMMVSNNVEVLPVIVDNKDIVKYYRNGTDYSVKVLDDNGDPAEGANVSFNINGVFYNRVCDENGVASLSINLNPGEYIITVSYNNMMVSNNVKILTRILSNNLIISKDNMSEFSITLFDDNGNPLANKNVKFTIGDKIYNVSSDKNGVASIKLLDLYKKSEINGLTKDRTIYLCCDNIYSTTKDKKMLNDCAEILRNEGYDVIVGGIGPNSAYSSLSKIPNNGVLLMIVGGLCSGTFVDLASKYYQNKLKSNNLQFVLGCLSPPITKDLDTLPWLERAHDDNFSPSSFKGLDFPGEYLIEHGIAYVYGSSGSNLANNLLDIIKSSNSYDIITTYDGYSVYNTITIV